MLTKSFLFFACLSVSLTCFSQSADITLQDTAGAPQISRHIYGQFAEHLGRSIYDGFYRKGKIRTDITAALRQLKIPNLRWPGGCFADQYHWRDGIGKRRNRPKTVNTTWGMVTEDNSFGTHEFLELCQLIGCEPYFAGNVGTGTPQEMSDWIEYLNFGGRSSLSALRAKNGHPAPYRVSWWGIGNESWGCGGNMTPDYYANLYKHYFSFCQDYPGTKLKPIVSGANADDYHWTDVCFKNIPTRMMWAYTLHYYTWITGHWPPSGSATTFSEGDYFQALQQALRMEEIVGKHAAIMDQYDPGKKVALLVDEWGIWTAPEPGTNPAFLFQQNSLRDALIATSTLNIFNNRADRVRGANLAQTVNVIHSLILTSGDTMVLTPTYHVFDLMKVHQDAKLVPISMHCPDYTFGGSAIKALNASASIDSTGATNLTLVNLDPNTSIVVALDTKARHVRGRVLTSASFTDCNTFQRPNTVGIEPFNDYTLTAQQLRVVMPPKSVVALTLD